jgi:hypothetical protein
MPTREYTCPMHPEVREGPGVGEEAGDATGPDPELTDMTRRCWISAALAVVDPVKETTLDAPAARHDAQYPGEPGVRVHLQRDRHHGSCRCALSG